MFADVSTKVHFSGVGAGNHDLVVFLPSGKLGCDGATANQNGAAAGRLEGGAVTITASQAIYYKICIFHPSVTMSKPTRDGDFSLSTAVLNVEFAPPPPAQPPTPPSSPLLQLGSAFSLSPALSIGLGVGGVAFVLALLATGYQFWRRSMLIVRNSLLVKSHIFDAEMNVYLKDCDEPVDLRGLMMGVLTIGSTNTIVDYKFISELRSLITGEPQDAALGYIHYMKVDPTVVHIGLSQGTDAIRDEFERYAGEHAEEARECLDYVLHQKAGSSRKTFQQGLTRDLGRDGETLADFVAHPNARLARLDEAHIVALRAYTTAAYKVINGPLRDVESCEPHPFPVTIAFLREAISKLRAVGAHEDMQEGKTETRLDLWRGMRDTEVTESFTQHGGTELAPMSTTTKLEVAMQYSMAATSLFFKLRTDSFMQRGASIQFLSAFPAEEEVLFPPLTFLKPTGKKLSLLHKSRMIMVVEVTPQFGG